MERYTVPEQQKNLLLGAIGLIALLTAASCIITAGGITTPAGGKITSITFILFIAAISGYSGTRWLKKGSPLYGFGLATLIVSLKTFVLYAIVLITESGSPGLGKYCFTFLVSSITMGYICGVATIRNTHSSVYTLKVVAMCAISVVGLYFIIQMLGIKFYGRFDIRFIMAGLFNNDQTGRIIATLILLAISFTCMAKAVSRLNEEPDTITIPRYKIPDWFAPYIKASIVLLAILTAITTVLLLGNGVKSEFTAKIVGTTFMATLVRVSTLSAARHLNRLLPTYNLGVVTIVICHLALYTFIVLMLGDVRSLFFIKTTISLAVLAAAGGYVCGIATLPGDGQEVKGLRITAMACTAALAFVLVYGVFSFSSALEDFGFALLQGGGFLSRLLDFAKILQVLILLSFGLTLITKLVSLLKYEAPADNLVFDYEKEVPPLPTATLPPPDAATTEAQGEPFV